MYDILDTILMRLVRKWVAHKMPELSHLPPETLLNMFLKSERCKEIVLAQNITHDIEESLGSEMMSDQIFRRSQGYFCESEKRPNQLSYRSH